jgi:two-component system sensor histidine kinase CreC
MSKRSRIFLGIFIVYLAAVAFLLNRVAGDLDPRYRESAEESLVDTANLLATLLERGVYEGTIPVDNLERTLAHLLRRPVRARIFDIEKTKVDLHVYVTDKNGYVLFDSKGRDVGADYLAWRDVQLTLDGEYGARTSLADPDDPRSSVMYVGAAIRERGGGTAEDGAPRADAHDEIVGMVAVGKPVAAFSPFIANARNKLLQVGAISVGAFALLLLISTVWLVRPFGLIADVWRAFRQDAKARGGGGLTVVLASPLMLGRRLLAALRSALAEARDTLAGRSYADQYVQTLAHELKSPLAAIRGAAELLHEPMPEAARTKFTTNIEEQVARAQDLIDRLLELSHLERRGALEAIEPVRLRELAQTVRDELLPIAEARGITLAVEVDDQLTVAGESFLLARALANLVRNSVDFAPAGSTIHVAARARGRQAEVTVRDYGPGLPAFAGARVFEKFFSLPRPATGKKSTGLGLAFVQEVAQLHGGSAKLGNHPEGGALATLLLPRAAAQAAPEAR